MHFMGWVPVLNTERKENWGTAQWVRRLLGKCWDVSSDPQHPGKIRKRAIEEPRMHARTLTRTLAHTLASELAKHQHPPPPVDLDCRRNVTSSLTLLATTTPPS